MKVDHVVIDKFQAYTYCNNIKIVGVPEKGTNESADETRGICVALFREMGADVSKTILIQRIRPRSQTKG